MREVVYGAKPHLKEIINNFGNESVLSYREKQLKVSSAPEERKKELEAVVYDYVLRLFGQETAARAVDTLDEFWFVSTAEHHVPASHPFILSGTFVGGLNTLKTGRDVQLIFSCAGVSMNNSSFPRGVSYHDTELTDKKIYFMPWKYRRHPVWNMPSAGSGLFDELEKNSDCQTKFRDLMIGLKKDFLHVNSYADQITYFNKALFQQFIGYENTALIYLTQETIVAELLTRFHLLKNTVINRLLFDTDWHRAFTKYFDGLTGAFNSVNGNGSWLFWSVKDGQRVSLHKENDNLVSADNKYSVALKPEAIARALANQEIMPTMALTFIVLSFYYGLNCGGGFSQVDYLPKMRTAYASVLLDFCLKDSVADQVQTDFLSLDYAFLSLQAGTRQVLATGVDMLLYGKPETFERIRYLAESVKLKDALDNLIPEFYAIAGGTRAVPIILKSASSCIYV